MINGISEGALRNAVKVDTTGTIERQVAQQKTEEVRRRRPVEDSQGGAKSESRDERNSDSSKYVLEGKTMVFEKYNRSGDLIYRLPPAKKPVDERV
jgi:hypothetical protein